jgi:ferredoxin-NADP reductase
LDPNDIPAQDGGPRMTQASTTLISEFESEVTVARIDRAAAADVAVLTLVRDGGHLPPWTPGAHVDVILDDGLVRQYSLCGRPADQDSYRIAVLRAPDSRGGSAAVHALGTGDRVRIRGPRNHFPLAAAARYVFVAGGIGITPILPMLEAADAAGADWVLHYGGRSLASMAFRDTLAGYGDRVHLVPQDEAGLLDLAAILGTPAPDTLVYCCGPEPLLAAVEDRCASWPGHALRLERFTARPREAEAGVLEDDSFELVLQRSGLTLRVPADRTVFDTMRAAGVSVLGSCLEGICGTCEQGVLDGEVDHRDSVLDEEEQAAQDCMMVCVSRARGPRLVLDA